MVHIVGTIKYSLDMAQSAVTEMHGFFHVRSHREGNVGLYVQSELCVFHGTDRTMFALFPVVVCPSPTVA